MLGDLRRSAPTDLEVRPSATPVHSVIPTTQGSGHYWIAGPTCGFATFSARLSPADLAIAASGLWLRHRCMQFCAQHFAARLRAIASRVGRIFHLGIAIGMAKAVAIKAPDIKTGRAQRIAPRKAIEPVGDGEARRKGGTVHIEDGENIIDPRQCHEVGGCGTTAQPLRGQRRSRPRTTRQAPASLQGPIACIEQQRLVSPCHPMTKSMEASRGKSRAQDSGFQA